MLKSRVKVPRSQSNESCLRACACPSSHFSIKQDRPCTRVRSCYLRRSTSLDSPLFHIASPTPRIGVRIRLVGWGDFRATKACFFLPMNCWPRHIYLHRRSVYQITKQSFVSSYSTSSVEHHAFRLSCNPWPHFVVLSASSSVKDPYLSSLPHTRWRESWWRMAHA